MDRPEISYMKPGKKDHYTKKVNGEKSHGQKRYLLWPLRDILDMLNGSDISVGDSLKDNNDETDENDGDSSSSSDSNGDDDAVCKYYQWKKGAGG